MTNDWDALRRKATLRLLQLHYEAQCGHLGGNLSCLDILLYLHHYVMKQDDVFILSKGHSAGALYIVLWTLGKITDEELKTFHKDGTHLCGHITEKYGVFGTGSLGHGLSLAVGMATAKKIRNEPGNVYCLLSDGELQEGSSMEAKYSMMKNRIGDYQYKIDNIRVIIDANGWQGFSKVEVPLVRWAGSYNISSENFNKIEKIFSRLVDPSLLEDQFLWVNTIKGKDTCYENMLESHYLPLNDQQYKEACERV